MILYRQEVLLNSVERFVLKYYVFMEILVELVLVLNIAEVPGT